MTGDFQPAEQSEAGEIYPIEPRYHPVNRVARKVYDALASAKLAMTLLVIILACCGVGVTVYRGQAAYQLIFNTLWFNALLVLLVLNVACCFFGRIWGRRVTVISFGMILFHLSFVTVFLGVVYNSLFCFRGVVRLTEGETVFNGDPQNYDAVDKGRFFSYSRLKGDTSLIAMHVGYKDDGKDKRVAYEVEVGEGSKRKRDIVYITRYLEYRGVKYFRDKEGYAILVTVADRSGKELFGAYIPLQSYKQKDDSFRYATGTKEGETAILMPQDSPNPYFFLQLAYHPSKIVERGGNVEFLVRPNLPENERRDDIVMAKGTVNVGTPFAVGDYLLTAREVRYWVGMQVAYEPGQPVILFSMWVGLAGIILTTGGRMMKGRRRLA